MGARLVPTNLPAGHCERLCREIIHDLSTFNRHSDHLYTFGTPLYLAQNDAHYIEANAPLRTRSVERFGVVYDALVGTMERYLGARVGFDPRLALPNVQVFRALPGRPYAGGMWHRDFFHTGILDVSRPEFSVSMLIGDEASPYAVEFCEESQVEIAVQYHRISFVTIFPAIWRHRIAPFGAPGRLLNRVSMQAHLSKQGDHYLMYW